MKNRHGLTHLRHEIELVLAAHDPEQLLPITGRLRQYRNEARLLSASLTVQDSDYEINRQLANIFYQRADDKKKDAGMDSRLVAAANEIHAMISNKYQQGLILDELTISIELAPPAKLQWSVRLLVNGNDFPDVHDWIEIPTLFAATQTAERCLVFTGGCGVPSCCVTTVNTRHTDECWLLGRFRIDWQNVCRVAGKLLNFVERLPKQNLYNAELRNQLPYFVQCHRNLHERRNRIQHSTRSNA